MPESPGDPIDIESFWEYSDPGLSEERFRAALSAAQGDQRLELLTQIARTYGLRGRFDEAHKLLDEVEGQQQAAGARPRIRCLLERGRTFNSGGQIDQARPLFEQAWQQAQAAGEEGLAVDAVHMLAITWSGTPDAIVWNQRGLAIARASQNSKARSLIPAMLNNSAWDLHATGRYAEALALFEEALVEWSVRGKPQQIRIARWSVARCLRSLGRCAEALAQQHALEAEDTAASTADGYVFEEIAENLAALGQMDEAKPYFGRAAEELSKDHWLIEHEPERLARLRARAE